MLIKSCLTSIHFLLFLICEFSDLLFSLDILFTEDKDAFEIAVIYKVVVDEILIINEHFKVVGGFAVGPDNSVILRNGVSDRRFSRSVIAIEEVDERELINRDICKSCSVERDIRNC